MTKLEAFREKRMLERADVAQACGLPVQTIWEIETKPGTPEDPRKCQKRIRAAICSGLKRKPGAFFDRAGHVLFVEEKK